MSHHPLPPIFVSHGSPMIALEPGDAGAFMQRLGPLIDRTFGRPRAIVSISAHTAARMPLVLAAASHAAVYDFGNFDPRLNTLRYDAPGDPALATRIVSLGAAAGVAIGRLDEGGLDHGAWTALRHLYPEADIPVVPLAFDPGAAPEAQFALGEVLAPLAGDGVLVLGSGSITHDLRRVFRGGLHPKNDLVEVPESRAFRDWMAERSAAHDWRALFAYRVQAPHAVDMHPTDEHLLPWYVAAGAGGRDSAPARIHASATMGVLGMDAYAFGPLAATLARSVGHHGDHGDHASAPSAALPPRRERTSPSP